jgi:hypothetical protein
VSVVLADNEINKSISVPDRIALPFANEPLGFICSVLSARFYLLDYAAAPLSEHGLQEGLYAASFGQRAGINELAL